MRKIYRLMIFRISKNVYFQIIFNYLAVIDEDSDAKITNRNFAENITKVE